jgi:hypothetical protein
MWKVYIVYSDGRKRLAGGVRGYRTKKAAEAAYKHYSRLARYGGTTTFKGCRVELVEE